MISKLPKHTTNTKEINYWKEREKEKNYFTAHNLISVVKMRSLCVKHNFSFPFKKPKTCTRNILLSCIPKLKRTTQITMEHESYTLRICKNALLSYDEMKITDKIRAIMEQ
jgi:hypothetical protein